MDTYEEIFSYNINRLRVNSGLTQKQFADKLGYSEKTISKWERAGSIPNINILYKISAMFNVSIDDLFRDKCTYLLGIDGGGTKTDYVLSDENLNVIRKLTSCGCNPFDSGIGTAKEILRKGIYEVCEAVHFSDVVMYAGISGGTSGSMKWELEKFFNGFGFNAFKNGSDTQNIFSASLGDDDGVIIIMGTGSCIVTQHDGIQGRMSGWGHLFDDVGSGYSIARDAFAAGFRSIDDLGEYTCFIDAVLKDYPDVQTLVGKLYDGGKKIIASFCPLVFECAKNNDAVCIEIIKNSMRITGDAIKKAANKVKAEKVKVIAAGSLTKEPMTIRYLTRALEDVNNVDLTVLNESPVKGALINAHKILNKLSKEPYNANNRSKTSNA